MSVTELQPYISPTARDLLQRIYRAEAAGCTIKRILVGQDQHDALRHMLTETPDGPCFYRYPVEVLPRFSGMLLDAEK